MRERLTKIISSFDEVSLDKTVLTLGLIAMTVPIVNELYRSQSAFDTTTKDFPNLLTEKDYTLQKNLVTKTYYQNNLSLPWMAPRLSKNEAEKLNLLDDQYKTAKNLRLQIHLTTPPLIDETTADLIAIAGFILAASTLHPFNNKNENYSFDEIDDDDPDSDEEDKNSPK